MKFENFAITCKLLLMFDSGVLWSVFVHMESIIVRSGLELIVAVISNA